jgi:hypothetical protein
MLGRLTLALLNRPVLDSGMKKTRKRPRPDQDLYWTGPVLDRGTHDPSTALPPGLDPQIQEARPDWPRGRPPRAIIASPATPRLPLST